MEEQMQQMEEMKHVILTQVLDQSARARCKFILLSMSPKCSINGLYHHILMDSKYASPWEAREGQNGGRDASEYGTTRTVTWQTWGERTNRLTRKCESTDAKEDDSQS